VGGRPGGAADVRRLLVVLAIAAAVVVGAVLVLRHEQPNWWVRLWYPLPYSGIVTGNARLYHLDPALVAAVIYEESRFNSGARSDAGAVGLMQLLPQTAKGIALHTGGGNFHPATDLLNPDLNVRYGCWYLHHLQDKYAAYRNGDALALAAYNAGQANVDRWIANSKRGGTVQIPFPETRDYVGDVQRVEKLYRRAYHDQLYG
jgi:peptidoglycan lytic transglycosylase